jgi:hypothetical protein
MMNKLVRPLVASSKTAMAAQSRMRNTMLHASMQKALHAPELEEVIRSLHHPEVMFLFRSLTPIWPEILTKTYQDHFS